MNQKFQATFKKLKTGVIKETGKDNRQSKIHNTEDFYERQEQFCECLLVRCNVIGRLYGH